jgi:hypothetical protein
MALSGGYMLDSAPQPLSQEELHSIRQRLKAATPGPWCHREGFIETAGNPGVLLGVTLQRSEVGLDTLPGQANAEFIAHAPTDVARLLGEVERLQDELAVERGDKTALISGFSLEEKLVVGRC